MSIITVTEKEQQLTHMLRITSEALDVCTAERDALEWDNEQLRRCAEVQEVDRYAALNRKYVKERDTYQVEADRLAWENKTLRDALAEVLKEAMPTYHDCVDDGEMECHWCVATAALAKKVTVEVSRDANPDEMNALHGEDYGVDWEYTRSKS
jgi:hypothetical protein